MASGAGQFLIQAVAEQSAIRQMGQGVVLRHVAQFFGHLRCQPQGTGAAHDQDPCQPGQGQTEPDTGDGDHRRGIATKAVFKLAQCTQRQCPVVAGHNHVFLG